MKKRLPSESRKPGMVANIRYEPPPVLSERARIAGEIRRREHEQDAVTARKIENLGKLIHRITGAIR